MDIKLYQVDAFASQLFSGNPAAVCPLQQWLPDKLMQNLAMENNLAETAFYVKAGDEYEIRWFTPETEVDLCGHATLASAHVLFMHEGETSDKIVFNSRSGKLVVTKDDQTITLDFPADIMQEVAIDDSFLSLFDQVPSKVFRGKTDLMFVFESESQIKNMQPDLARIAKLGSRGAIITAKGNVVDFVSRFFAPQCGINEDPVTGSAHTSLTPFWAKELYKTDLTALQLSARGGMLTCRNRQDRVEISGNAVTFLIGTIFIDTQ